MTRTSLERVRQMPLSPRLTRALRLPQPRPRPSSAPNPCVGAWSACANVSRLPARWVERPEVDGSAKPAVVLMVGVNGTGKTTTVGKLARILVAEDKSVILGAADTFRAAAADQLATWGERVGVDVVRSDRECADPASVAFEAVREGA